ncbi:MAG: phospholipase D-like domain-containing protein [Myxococcaceae bacterium]
MSPARKTKATQWVPIRDMANEWRVRLRMIHEASRFIYATTYYVEDDAYGEQFLGALTAAARRGVSVFLGFDVFGQRLGNSGRKSPAVGKLEAQLGALAQAGGVIAPYRPLRFLQRILGAGQHIKVQLSERGEALLASGNICQRSYALWGEFSALVKGPIVPRLLDDIAQVFNLPESSIARNRASLEEAASNEAVSDNEAGGESGLSFDIEHLCFDPNAHSKPRRRGRWFANPITERLVSLLDEARQEVVLTSFHCKPTDVLAEALIRAARRGVQVSVVHSSHEALLESRLPWLSAAMAYPKFLEAGIQILEHPRGEHSKLLSVDGRRVAFGSYNFEHAAHERLAEQLFVSDAPKIVQDVREVLLGLLTDPGLRRVVTDGPHSRGLLRLQRWVWRPLRRWV